MRIRSEPARSVDLDDERAMRRLSAADLSGLLAVEGEDQDEDENDAADPSRLR
ncbi:hypothetical protein LGM65_30330 [Burkholderia anthina]|uniref:hypothetical protein n=1 Tax=Burkholderia anthina TaxID=179879 RepID=UPI001CF0FF38|nr:hypothetical protein [Burkholderia anthina]MCA8095120.1 hypothetical protein [Burkholderia anthina]